MKRGKNKNLVPGGDQQEIPSRRGGEGFEVLQGIAIGSLRGACTFGPSDAGSLFLPSVI